jgi:hypothetical protein
MSEPYSRARLPELAVGPPLFVFNLRFVAGEPYSRVRFPERRGRAGRISEEYSRVRQPKLRGRPAAQCFQFTFCCGRTVQPRTPAGASGPNERAV